MNHKAVGIGLLVLLALMLGAPVMAQDAAEEPVALEPWVCPEGFVGQTLNVYNWSTYVAEDTISNFEALCGITVVYDTFESNESLLARLRQGNPGYDIVVPTGHTVAQMVAEDLLIPLTADNIPNLTNLSEALADPVYDPGNAYSVPYQWGTTAVGYNTTKIDEITSWEQVFTYDGPVAWLDEPRMMMGVALRLLGFDANSVNPDEIAARDFLIENGDNVVYIAADDGQERLASGEVDIAVEYMGDIFQIGADCECEDFGFALPETAQVWVDNLAIPTGAQNPALAEVFIDYVLDPQVGADIANYTAYASPNQLAIDGGLIDPLYGESPVIYPDETTIERLFTVLTVPDAEQLYNDAWDEVKILIGG